MPKTKEFSVHLKDEPGMLAKVCRALADAKVNIMAFQSIPWEEGESVVRLVASGTRRRKLSESNFRTGRVSWRG